MFYYSAQRLLQWLASIQMNLLQLAATAEPGQSIVMRRIAVVRVNDSAKQNMATRCCAVISHERTEYYK